MWLPHVKERLEGSGTTQEIEKIKRSSLLKGLLKWLGKSYNKENIRFEINRMSWGQTSPELQGTEKKSWSVESD